jgi:flavin reductase (DIM6/NTAB) family NADH-FMN oxidoreductase RutF
MLPSIHHRLPFLDLNLRNFALQATSGSRKSTRNLRRGIAATAAMNFGPPGVGMGIARKKRCSDAIKQTNNAALNELTKSLAHDLIK